MSSIRDTLNKLKTTIVQTQTKKIDQKLDMAVNDIVSYKSNSGRYGYVNLVKSLISKTADVQIGNSGSGVFSQGASPTSFGQGSRIGRYKNYQAIVTQLNYPLRALNVLVDNILSPDDITKQTLEIKPKLILVDDETLSSKIRYVKEVINILDLERRLDGIIKNTLLFGDFFVEVAGVKESLAQQSVISENFITGNSYDDFIDRERIVIGDGKAINLKINFNALNETVKPSKSKISGKDLKNLKIILHDPKFVVKLQSSLFPLCFGYLIFPIRNVMPASVLADDAVNNICISILKNLAKRMPEMKEFEENEELKDIIKYLVASTDINKSMNVRYVPPDKMQHFYVPSTKYFPYGESIFDSAQFTAKVLTSLETALAVQRLARSTEKRKVAIEVGLPRDARKAVESLKEELRKRKVSLDSFGSVDTIPSMVTTFEDVYIPQKDGKPFVDISTFTEGNVDTRNKVEELKFLRDQLVAGVGVPPSFIGIEENLSNKNALTEENILFARTIISHQKYLSHQLREFVQKIFDIIDPKEAFTIFDNVEVCLPAPRSLQYEREARYMNEVTNLIENLDRIGIPKEYSKKRYLSQIDWVDVQKYSIEDKVEKELDPKKKAEDEGGLGGIGGGSFGAGGFGGGI